MSASSLSKSEKETTLNKIRQEFGERVYGLLEKAVGTDDMLDLYLTESSQAAEIRPFIFVFLSSCLTAALVMWILTSLGLFWRWVIALVPLGIFLWWFWTLYYIYKYDDELAWLLKEIGVTVLGTGLAVAVWFRGGWMLQGLAQWWQWLTLSLFGG